MIRAFYTILIVLILVGGLYLLSSIFSKDRAKDNAWTFDAVKKPEMTLEQVQKSQEEQARADIDLYNSALEAKDKEICDAISDVSQKIRCHDMIEASIALESGDPKRCDRLTQTGMIDRCRDNVYFAQATLRSLQSSCDPISDENLLESCRNSVDEKIFAEKVASGSVSEEFCMSLGGPIRDTCMVRVERTTDADLYQKALLSKSFEDCDAIREEKLRIQCRDALIFEIAIKEGNSDLCQSIADPEKITYCLQNFQVRNEKELYRSIIKSLDITECSKLNDEKLFHQCHDMITLSYVRRDQDRDLCTTLYNTGLITNCMTLIR